MKQEERCAAYLRSKDLSIFMRQVRKKWETYGRVTGIVTLKNVSASAREALEGILGKRFQEEDIKVSVKSFETALQNSVFENVDFKLVLDAYFGEKVLSTKERQQIKNDEQVAFRKSLFSIVDKTDLSMVHDWLTSVLENKDAGYYVLLRLMKDKQMHVFTCVVDGIVQILTKEDLRMPISVFAAEISGNPHFLDRNNDGAKLLMSFLSFYYHVDVPKDSQSWYMTFACAGLMKDAIAGSVAIYNLHLERNGVFHQGAEACYQYGEPFMLSSANFVGVQRILSQQGIVYVVENEMVFTYLLELIKDTSIALVCTSGQLSTTAQCLIQLMADNQMQIYYSGDIDPEGIGICDRLYAKYPQYIIPWHMDRNAYMLSLSQECISEERLRGLESIMHPILSDTSKALGEIQKAGYQENILQLYERDLVSKNVR